jgi:hypothetical protein
LRRLPPFELGERPARPWRASRSSRHPVRRASAAACIGGLATFFALQNNPLHGGLESALLTGTGKVATRRCSVPLLARVLLLPPRVVAGARARLGAMERSNQIAALQMMGARPADLLLTPLVWGDGDRRCPSVTLCRRASRRASPPMASAAAGVGHDRVGCVRRAWLDALDARDAAGRPRARRRCPACWSPSTCVAPGHRPEAFER